jgi:hypothetical protein
MSRLDLRKTLGPLYAASARTVTEVDVPAFTFLMVDGRGDPNEAPAYRE